MKYVLVVFLTLNFVVLLIVALLHSLADNHRFSLNRINIVKPNEIERQRYVQYSNDPSYLLFGYRHQKKIGDMKMRHTKLDIETLTDDEVQANKTRIDEGKPRKFVFGFSQFRAGKPQADFYGHYVFVKFWIIELILIVPLVVCGWMLRRKLLVTTK